MPQADFLYSSNFFFPLLCLDRWWHLCPSSSLNQKPDRHPYFLIFPHFSPSIHHFLQFYFLIQCLSMFPCLSSLPLSWEKSSHYWRWGFGIESLGRRFLKRFLYSKGLEGENNLRLLQNGNKKLRSSESSIPRFRQKWFVVGLRNQGKVTLKTNPATWTT